MKELIFDNSNKSKKKDPMERNVDTIVCPAKEEGFKEIFLAQSRWYPIRLSSKMIPKLKYIAIYETTPVSSIRWIGEVEKIEKCKKDYYEGTGKYEIIIKNKQKIKPIPLSEEPLKEIPYGPKYSRMSLIKKARYIRDIFPF